MPDPIIDKSFMNQSVNKDRRARPAVPGDGTIKYLLFHQTENPDYLNPTAVLEYGLVHGPVVGQRGCANWYVMRDGRLVHMIVEETFIAWHAGTSQYQGLRDEALSAASIGIEVDLPGGTAIPPNAAQWAALEWLAVNLSAYWHIPQDAAHWLQHKDVAVYPITRKLGRRKDPSSYSVADLLHRIQGK